MKSSPHATLENCSWLATGLNSFVSEVDPIPSCPLLFAPNDNELPSEYKSTIWFSDADPWDKINSFSGVYNSTPFSWFSSFDISLKKP